MCIVPVRDGIPPVGFPVVLKMRSSSQLKDLLQETESERQQTHEEAFALKQRLMEVESEIEVRMGPVREGVPP